MNIPYFLPQVQYGSDNNTYWGFTFVICILLLMLSFLEISFKKK